MTKEKDNMNTLHNPKAVADRYAYNVALINNDLPTCVDIERRYGLYGLVQELVIIGLDAACMYKDPLKVVDDYINARCEDGGSNQPTADSIPTIHGGEEYAAGYKAGLEAAAWTMLRRDKEGREWIMNTLWDTLLSQCAARIMALAPKEKS